MSSLKSITVGASFVALAISTIAAPVAAISGVAVGTHPYNARFVFFRTAVAN